MHKKSPIAILLAASMTVSTGIVPLALAQGLPAEQIRQGEARQQQIKAQTDQVSRALDALIDEFRRNGLDGADVDVLRAIRGILGKLTDQEMQKVIQLLQEARSAPDTNSSRRAVAGAVSDQKNIVAQMRQLLLEYQRQQALYELSLRLAALAERQNAGMLNTVDLARRTGTRTALQYDDEQKAILQVQGADQQAIKDEANPILTKLEAIAKESEGETRDRLTKAMARAKESNIKPALDLAVTDLRSAALFRAAGTQKNIRDTLRELSRLVAPPKSALDRLKNALAEIDKAIDNETAIAEQARRMERREDAAALERKQAEVVDRTDTVRQDIQNLAPDAASELKDAQDQMQEARAAMTDRNRDAATKDAREALAKLEAAKKALQEEIAKADTQNPAADKLASAKELQEKTRALIKQEEAIQSQTAASEKKSKELKALAPTQADVEDQTQDVQRQAATQHPDAAQALNDAAQQMDKSEKNLAKPEGSAPKTAQEAQAAALSALKQADEKLTEQIKELEQASEDLAELLDSRAKIEKLIQQQQRLQQSTNKAAAKAPTPAGNPSTRKPVGLAPVKSADRLAEVRGLLAGARLAITDAGKPASAPTDNPADIATQQGQLASDTDKVRTELLDDEKAAHQPLDEARRNMSDAKSKLTSANVKAALPDQAQALVNLYKAKAELDKKIEQLQQQLGQQPNPAQAAADAAEQIKKLQEQVAQAQETLNDNPADLARDLQQQQRDIAKALEEMTPADGQPNAPLEQAEAAAKQAAEALAQNKNPEAAQAMQRALQNMQQAMKSQPAQAQPPAQGEQPTEGQPPAQGEQPPEGQQPPQGQSPVEGQQPAEGQQPPEGQQPAEGQPPAPGEGQGERQGVPALAQKQEQLMQQLAAMQAGQGATGAAAPMLDQAAQGAGQLASSGQGLPSSAQVAVQQAAAALSDAAAQAGSANAPAAQASAAQAQAALAQAAASLALAQAGLNSGMAQAPGKGKGQGQGQGQGQGEQPGQGQGQGQGQAKGQGPGQGQGQGSGDRTNIQGGGFADGQRRDDTSGSSFIGLPERDRKALVQSQADKYPEQYAPQVEQYLRNLAESEE